MRTRHDQIGSTATHNAAGDFCNVAVEHPGTVINSFECPIALQRRNKLSDFAFGQIVRLHHHVVADKAVSEWLDHMDKVENGLIVTSHCERMLQRPR